MKHIAYIVCLLAGLLTGCTGAETNDAQRDIKTDKEIGGKTISVSDRKESFNQDNKNGQFGYVRYQANSMPDDTQTKVPTIDREKTAHVISSLTVQLPHVQDAATLVTDKEALIVYQTNSKRREQTADQVKKTAASVIPRYYHVYISDNPNLVQSIENYSRLRSDSRDISDIMADTIQEMKKSPQGGPVSEDENANGETDQDQAQGPLQTNHK
ncbi:YhcN/YlaJ family sporulation lipoprotein [Bacillus atrophaeus]|uniref:YhcN/YlaJ family sporulation lipoprotein n=1 Tax=Bacillus atrophaeus TaxID=1452 RepID=UPI00240DE5DE|nr:YhcN/YlaJ family sporulation lipoprotein [Bacillus atrophaeus]